MYEVFWNAFMAKPAIDLGVVPDFMRIMFSIHMDVSLHKSLPFFFNETSFNFTLFVLSFPYRQFRVERQWIIKLCADSLIDTSEYLMMEKSRVYKYCLLLYSDPGVDPTTQVWLNFEMIWVTLMIPFQ